MSYWTGEIDPYWEIEQGERVVNSDWKPTNEHTKLTDWLNSQDAHYFCTTMYLCIPRESIGDRKV